MSEVLARQVEDRPVERLLTHYADGSDAAVADATKLTLGNDGRRPQRGSMARAIRGRRRGL